MSPNGWLYSNHFVIAPFFDNIQNIGDEYINHLYVTNFCPDLTHQVTNLIADETNFSPTSVFIATWYHVPQSGGNHYPVSIVYILLVQEELKDLANLWSDKIKMLHVLGYL